MTKQVIKTLVVDDEPLARRGLRARLERHDDIQVLAECQNGLEAVSTISQLRPLPLKLLAGERASTWNLG